MDLIKAEYSFGYVKKMGCDYIEEKAMKKLEKLFKKHHGGDWENAEVIGDVEEDKVIFKVTH